MLEEQNKGKHQSHSNKRSRTSSGNVSSKKVEGSNFQALFTQRAQGFRIDFSFRNAPPRPPVGPCFVGQGLEGQLQDLSTYRPLNAVELSHNWKLHAEQDLGVPIAPSAMDLNMYTSEKKSAENTVEEQLHPDDDALLNWQGPMGDTAAEEFQRSKDQARAEARLALAGKTVMTPHKANQFSKKSNRKRKDFSRVLDHGMVFFMKKTTYLSNDYSRKVHDFTSLAESKAKTAAELQARQEKMDRSANAVEKTFAPSKLVHPTKKHLKPVSELPLLPNDKYWGEAYTHVVFDNAPKATSLATEQDIGKALPQAFVANVVQRSANEKMTCQVLIPATTDNDYKPLAQYDLDVIPLKESEEAAHTNFCLLLDNNEATYLPVPSRVQLSTGRPAKRTSSSVTIHRRQYTEEERQELRERIAQVNKDEEDKEDEADKDKEDVEEGKKDDGFGEFDDDEDDDDDDMEDE